MDDMKKQLGLRIRQARMKQGLSQLELSDMAQVSPSHLSDIERGKKDFGIDIFIRLVNALQVSADRLLELNTPTVTAMLDKEFGELLSDCTVSEKRRILKMAREMKEGLRDGKD